MMVDGVALIKVGDLHGVMNVSEFYGAFVRGTLLRDAAGHPRRFASHAEAVGAYVLAAKPAQVRRKAPADF